jgi:uncharacterized membrane protein YhhN
MSAETAFGALSGAASLLYGFWLLRAPVSFWRTLAKTTAVAALAVLAYVAEAPVALPIALVLSAAGDAFLASEQEGWLPAGLGAFLLAHLAYVWLFLHDGGGRAALIAEPVRSLGVAAAFAVGVTMLAWLWRSLGAMRPAVVVYVAALCAMAASSFTLPYRLWPAMAGAVAFIASDGILSAELFKTIRSGWSPYAVWGLYYAAQALIVWAYLR